MRCDAALQPVLSKRFPGTKRSRASWLAERDRELDRASGSDPAKPPQLPPTHGPGDILTTEIHLYGKLRGYAENSCADQDSVIKVEPRPDETIGSLLARVGIAVEEVYHIFHNSKLLATRNAMAASLGYRQARADPFDWNLGVPVKSGDRVGLFGEDIASLVV